MSNTHTLKSLVYSILVVSLGGMLLKWAFEARRIDTPVSARHVEGKEEGEFGGDMEFLREHFTAPLVEGESNYFVDLWTGGRLVDLVREQGLTNNRTLFVDSHGRSGFSWHRGRYGIYPHRDLIAKGQEAPGYSAGDLARLLGTAATNVHNIVLAGCNTEGRLRSQEFRTYFVNATNITHMAKGELAFKPMFIQAICKPSSEIKPLYGLIRTVSSTRIEGRISDVATPGSKLLGAYVADLYLPGARKPFRTQRAGRELLAPETESREASLKSATVARAR